MDTRINRREIIQNCGSSPLENQLHRGLPREARQGLGPIPSIGSLHRPEARLRSADDLNGRPETPLGILETKKRIAPYPFGFNANDLGDLSKSSTESCRNLRWDENSIVLIL